MAVLNILQQPKKKNMGINVENFISIIKKHNYFLAITLLMTAIFLVASSLVCAESIENCNGDGEILSVALGAINFLLTLILFIIVSRDLLNDIIIVLLSVILFILCTVAAAYATFIGPHVLVTNGFASAWLSSLSSLGSLVSCNVIQEKMGYRITESGIPVVFEIAASFLVLAASLVEINDCCDEQDLLALTASVIGILVGFFRLIIGPGNNGSYNSYFGIFLTIWWSSLGTFVTFGIFEEVGNGYLGVLVALLSSIYLLHKANKANPLF